MVLGLLASALVVAGAVVAGSTALGGHHASTSSPTHSSTLQGSPGASPAPPASADAKAVAPHQALWQLTPAPAAPAVSPFANLPATAAIPNAAAISKQLVSVLGDPAFAGDTVALVVADARSGALLVDDHGSALVGPASTAKLAVAVAALHVLGPDRQFTTKVVLAPAGRLMLVGGGDPTLAGPTAVGAHAPGYPAPARLSDLAQQTASALKAKGMSAVSLGYDASLFTGPPTAPGWKPVYVNEGDVAPVSALEVDEGSPDLTKLPRAADPAALAAKKFAALLNANGITVTGTAATTKATPDDEVLASVASPRLSALVQRMLGRSDNDVAEALARQVAIATGKPATFAGGAAAVRAALVGLGVPASGLAMVDGSGLSTADRVQPKALVGIIDLVLEGRHTELSSMLQALPVAGFSGTLANRFTKSPAASAAGRIFAKTGTLDGAYALAGYLDDASGRVLSFALIANNSALGAPSTTMPPGATAKTEDALDRVAAVLAGCGCS
ncbi:MAG: D-alanyl-D-alanine carboxypeptidase/D-alanyl-D-alanine endopeptidase [Acidothermaceae bacterium]